MPIFRSETVEVDRDVDGSLHLTLDAADRPMNVFNRKTLTDLDAALDALRDAARTSVLVVRSGKKSGFVAGADLKEFQAVTKAADAEAISAAGQKIFAKLAELPMPTIAAVSGPCLGGGLELALACDYRLVFDRRDTQLGLPETQLGILPAWGGTQRLPRVVGLERALIMILRGRQLDAREAYAWGLADAVAATEDELRQQFSRLAGRAIKEGKRDWRRFPRRTWRQRLLESNPLGRRLLFRVSQRILKRQLPDDLPAPYEALEAVRVGLRPGLEAGLAYERAAAGRLALTPAARNLVGLFLAVEQARKLPELLGAAPAEVQRVGVVGAGVMGAGIAQLAALRGYEVVVREVNNAALEAGQRRIQELFDKAVERRVIDAAEARRGLAALHGTVNWDEFDAADVVIEAAVEDLEAKRAVFHDLAARTRPDAVLATNTSSLSVRALEEGVRNPGRVAGLHFFNPVHRMRLVEVVRTPDTDAGTLATLAQLAVRLGKVPVLVGDGPGFVVNRILMPYLNEAVLLVGEGMAIDQVDRVMKRFGMTVGPGVWVGPLQVLDQVGLDVAAHVARATAPAVAERFPPNTAFERMQQAGWLGQKSGKGFYIYKGKKAAVNPEAQALLRGEGGPAGPALPPAARLAEARERMVLLMVNEAAMVLGQGLADGAEAIDLAMVLGTGWAPHRGGPLHYADARGLGEVVQALRGLAARHGRRFEPCAELLRRADRKELFVQPRTPTS
jgi:3-hydroxyacyl-CoA dehydrogenase/enoyl-CoA hydratase/3-hydroxybutyryl-CoA epimerase